MGKCIKAYKGLIQIQAVGAYTRLLYDVLIGIYGVRGTEDTNDTLQAPEIHHKEILRDIGIFYDMVFKKSHSSQTKAKVLNS